MFVLIALYLFEAFSHIGLAIIYILTAGRQLIPNMLVVVERCNVAFNAGDRISIMFTVDPMAISNAIIQRCHVQRRSTLNFIS